MAAETDLKKLIATLRPELLDDLFVFCCVTKQDGDFENHYKDNELRSLKPMVTVHEQEGLTVVVNKSVADNAELEYAGVFRCITLCVHSSLQAVGLTAAVSGALAERNISANVVAGFYHDHIFVAENEAESALKVLSNLPNQ